MILLTPFSPGADPGTGTVQALWQVQECVIENNVIELIPSFMAYGSPVGILLAASPPAAFVGIGARVFRRVVIRNNLIRYVDNLTEQTVRNVAIDLSYCEDALVESNIVDLAIAEPIRHSNSNSVRYFQNTNPSGQLIQGRFVPPAGPSMKQDELTTFVEDAATLCIL